MSKFVRRFKALCRKVPLLRRWETISRLIQLPPQVAVSACVSETMPSDNSPLVDAAPQAESNRTIHLTEVDTNLAPVGIFPTMTPIAPPNFSIEEFYQGIYTFQSWEIFPGHTTRGPKDVIDHMNRLKIPARLDGLRVLDIAPWNGFFSFECVRRGAAEVVSLGPDDPELTGYNKTKNILDIKNCTYVRAGVYDLSIEQHGEFDIVLFLGLIYHLRHPLLALDKIHDICTGSMFIDSPVIDKLVFDKTINDEEKSLIVENSNIIHDNLPMLYFTAGSETGDPYNWFIPNIKALKDFVTSSGFVIDHYVDDGGGWASIAAKKDIRPFKIGLEGWNEAAATRSN